MNLPSNVTLDGQLVGTPRYVSPEQARGEQITPQSDVYSLGVVAYELLLGHAPFDADSPTELMAMHLLVPPPPPRDAWPSIPARLERLLQHMLAKQPSARPTLAHVISELREVRRELREPRKPPAVIVEDEEPAVVAAPRRRRWWPAAAGVALGASMALGLALQDKAVLAPLRVVVPAPVVRHEEPPKPGLVNPVLEDCADPNILRDGERAYMTCTGRRRGSIYPIYTSTDLQSWEQTGWIFPDGHRPAWATGNYWAPELRATPTGYAAYFSMRAEGGRNAIGVATASTVGGPYRASEAPILEPPGGASDAHVFVDGNERYLYYKSEQGPASIWMQPLARDGLTVQGAPRRVLAPTEPWERDNIEAPAVVRRGDWYYLFYSGARYCDDAYAIGVARATSPSGPFEKQRLPLIASGAVWLGPGHPSIIGDAQLAYHAYRAAEGEPSCTPTANKRRHVVIEPITYTDGWPHVGPDVPRS